MRNNVNDFSDIFDLAAKGLLHGGQIEALSLHTRCRLISGLADVLKKNPAIDWNNIVSDSLGRISKSFQVSDHYYEWEDLKIKILEKRLKNREFRPTLNAVRHWKKMPEAAQKEALVDLSVAHYRTFSEGMGAPVPISHTFVSWMPRKSQGNVVVLYGTFNGSLARGKGKIKQNIHEAANFGDALHALDTSHHEMTHGIHFFLANEFHHGRVRPDHPLYEEARYFHAMEVRQADVPPMIYNAYRAQMLEYLAEAGGTRVAKMIYELAV